jgi:hypothetical protein
LRAGPCGSGVIVEATTSQQGEEPMMTTTAGRHGLTGGILAGLGLLAATAAVAGLATFGNFTDSTTPSQTSLSSGVLSIRVSVPGGAPRGIPLNTTGFVPGASITGLLNLDNDGTVPLSSIRLATTATTSNALVTDPTNGLQLTLQECSRRWTVGGTTDDPTYTCDQTQRTLYSGRVISTAVLPSPDSLAPGGTDNLVYTVSLPATAGDSFQGLTTGVTLAFAAAQAPGSAH